jgi:xylan 1,4-beta-xylosidase
MPNSTDLPSAISRRRLLGALATAPFAATATGTSLAESSSASSPTAPAMPLSLSCDLSGPPTALRHPWRHCVGSCHAPLALRADWQQQLARARRELGLRHVRFHGLLGDDMSVLVDIGGRTLYSFFNIDRIFDYLLSIGMRPIVELSFMPGAIASDGNTVFHYRANVTPPRRMADWTALMTRLATHWCERYGIDEVAQWPLEVWNEPNLKAFWTGGKQGYFEFWRATWQALKTVSPRLQVGGPATAANGWLEDFNAYAQANGCRADFISTHYYPTDAFGLAETDTVAQLARAPISVMRDRALEARRAAGDRPLYYTEWNITSNPRDPMHDGPFCAALAARFALDVDATVDAWSWWAFTDVFEENYFPSVPYHGGFGLLNLYGVPKPVYRGFELLAELGTRAWPCASGHPTVSAAVGARDPGDDATSVLLLNVALPRHPIAAERVTLEIARPDGRPPRAASVSRIDDAHANPRAAWEAMGRPEYPSARQVAELEAASVVVAEPLEVAHDGSRTRFTLDLPPDAMALVRIDWEGAAA